MALSQSVYYYVHTVYSDSIAIGALNTNYSEAFILCMCLLARHLRNDK